MDQIPQDTKEAMRKTEISESDRSELKEKDSSKENEGLRGYDDPKDIMVSINVNDVKEGEHPPAYSDASQGDINMEASISAHDILRAGGFGARDDISSVFPAASDFTDFEASLLDARVYEEPQEPISRPGLGWANSEK